MAAITGLLGSVLNGPPPGNMTTRARSEKLPSWFGSIARSMACVITALLAALRALQPKTLIAYKFAFGATPGPILKDEKLML